jgi:hypothetical protein
MTEVSSADLAHPPKRAAMFFAAERRIFIFDCKGDPVGEKLT